MSTLVGTPIRFPVRTALAQFVLIVVGVLVALAAESAWSARQDRAREAEYLGALLEEARGNLRAVEVVMDVTERKRAALSQVDSLLSTGRPEESAALFLQSLLQGSGIAVVPQFSRAVFDDLQNSGRLSLIQDDRTRIQIVHSYSLLTAMVERHDRWSDIIASGLHALASRYTPPGIVQQSRPFLVLVEEMVNLSALHRAVRELVVRPELTLEIRAAWRALDAETTILVAVLGATERHTEMLVNAVGLPSAPLRTP